MLTVDFGRFPVGPGHRVLDLGCGGGRHAFEAYRRGADVVAVDLSANDLRDVRGMLRAMRAAHEAPSGSLAHVVRGDALRLPFPDRWFDRVIASEVLEHIPDDGGAMAEISRVLRPGGLVAVTVPRWWPERLCWALSEAYHGAEGGHVRIYSRRGLAGKLRRAGLQTVGRHHAHALHSPYWWLKCLVGVDRDEHPAVKAYHHVLAWDIERRPWVTRGAERMLNPVLGKSVVLYLRKPVLAGTSDERMTEPMPRPEAPALRGVLDGSAVDATASWIASVQEPSGAIPWFPGGQVDAWDHVECAMALSAAGRWADARRAFEWLRRTQRADGSWPLRMRGRTVEDAGADANHCAYLAVGVWHHLLVSGDEAWAWRMWPTVRRAIEFVLGLQTARGEVRWARDARDHPAGFALLAASASIHHSLRCAIRLAERRGDPQPDWELAAAQLAHAVADHPEAFADRSRWSMDWYYPVLGGALRGPSAGRRMRDEWDRFVVPGLGVRCVQDRPWVTGAETCELALALDALGERRQAEEQLASMQHLRDPDGSYWTGLEYLDGARWPVERTTWTGAAVILAVDALSGATGGSGIVRDAAAPARDEIDFVACGCEPALAPSADAVADAFEHS